MTFEDDYEMPSQQAQPSHLPVKSNGKWVYPKASIKTKELPELQTPSESSDNESDAPVSAKPSLVLIANLAKEIMSNPQLNYKLLSDLLKYAQHPDLSHKEHLLSILSLCRIFLDILPDYPIREYSQTDLSAKLKKDVKILRNYENGLLQYYQQYLQYLNTLIKSGYKSNNTSEFSTAFTCIKCLEQMITSKSNFNFSKNILNVLVFHSHLGSMTLSDCELKCQDVLIRVIERDTLGRHSLEITQFIIQLINKRQLNVHGNIIGLLKYVKVTHKIFNPVKAKTFVHMSKKEKKRYKMNKVIEQEMKEATSTFNEEEQAQFQRQLLECIFQISFKIIKKSDPKGELVSGAIENIALFGQFLSLELIPSIYDELRRILFNEAYSTQVRIKCGFCAKSLCFRGTDELTIDLTSFLNGYYQLLDILTPFDDMQCYLTTLSDLLWRTRVTTTSERTSAFIKKLSTYLLSCTNPEVSMGILFLIRLFMITWPKCIQMLEKDEEKVFSGKFNPFSDECDSSFAIGSNLWELQHVAKFHYCKDIRDATVRLLLDLQDLNMDKMIQKPDPRELDGYFKLNWFHCFE
eukprot:NODE_237_length_11991_cov_1.642899.p1 type:complete len:577 gc:universal NODE_237_length_11991_cov_1.642899:1802-3532(+)